MGLFGGGNSSSTSNTTNNAYDQRSVSDAGGGVLGSGNTVDTSYRSVVDNSVTSSSNWADSSTNSTSWADNSTSSQSWADNSNRSLNTSNSGNTSSVANWASNWAQNNAWADNSNHSLTTSNSGNTSSVANWASAAFDYSNRSLNTSNSGNTSSAWTSQAWDNSNRSLNTSNSGNTSSAWSWADNSNRSLNTSNSGNTSTNWTNASRTVNNSTNNVTAVDAGAVGASFDAIKSLGSTYAKFGTDALSLGAQSLGFAGGAVGDALKFAQGVQQAGYAAQADAFGGALSRVTEAFGKALNFGQAQQTQAAASVDANTRQVAAAYADAKGRGSMTDYIIAAAIVGVVLVAWKAAR